MGWQGTRGAISASYLHTVIAGAGLIGAYNSNSANGAGSWAFARYWAAHVKGSYSTISAAVPLVGVTYQNGDTIEASGSIVHDLSEHLTIEGGYERLHQNFSGIDVISRNPDSDRIYLTASYRFERLLGR